MIKKNIKNFYHFLYRVVPFPTGVSMQQNLFAWRALFIPL